MTVGSPGHICVLAGVNNKLRPSRTSLLSRRASACDGGDDGQRLLLWSEDAYVLQALGALPGDSPMREATAQHRNTVRPENPVCRVCGLHQAAWTTGHMLRQRWHVRDSGKYRKFEPTCVAGSQVCTLNAQRGIQKLPTPLRQECDLNSLPGCDDQTKRYTRSLESLCTRSPSDLNKSGRLQDMMF